MLCQLRNFKNLSGSILANVISVYLMKQVQVSTLMLIYDPDNELTSICPLNITILIMILVSAQKKNYAQEIAPEMHC